MPDNCASMKKILLLCCLFSAFFACKKEDNTRTVSGYGQAIDSMYLSYNHTYLFFFERTVGGVTTVDSDRVLFRSNGTVSEVRNYYDILSHTYPDTITYTINTSFDYNINWSQVPNALLFSAYPIHDSVRGYLLHDYLNNDVVCMYRTLNDVTSNNQIKVIHALPDSTSYVFGYIKKL